MKLKTKLLTALLGTAVLAASCGGGSDEASSESKKDQKDLSDKKTRDEIGKKTTLEARVGEYKFSVPSPTQMAKIIKGSNASFDETMVNSHENAANYGTRYKRALNLGVYGADLGYLTIYESTNDAMSYLTSITTLSKELQISGAFDDKLMEKFADNMEYLNNEDSLSRMVSDAYRAGNAYLQQEKRYDVIGLMLTGGYIESLFFAVEVAKSTQSQDVLNSIGGQRSSLTNLIGLLNKVNSEKNDDQIAGLVKKLIDLESSFNNVESEYIYRRSETKADERLTIIKSITNVKISDETLAEITTKVEDIRNDIIK